MIYNAAHLILAPVAGPCLLFTAISSSGAHGTHHNDAI
jgi:hypothetical protein